MDAPVGPSPRSTTLVNWLSELDRKANTLPRATNWVQPYGLFMLMRYARLRPRPWPNDARSKRECWVQEATAARILQEWESRIANHSETAVCLNGLSAKQRGQLAALLIETVEEFEYYKSLKGKSQWANEVQREARRRTRILDRKLQKARKAVGELRSYAEDSRVGKSPDQPDHAARVTLGYQYRIAAANALQSLVVPPPRIEVYESLRGEYPTPDRAETFGMVRLYWFFRHECGLTGHDSEVRVARLRNAFWTDYGASPVTCRPTYKTGESSGCEAVRLAVRRFR